MTPPPAQQLPPRTASRRRRPCRWGRLGVLGAALAAVAGGPSSAPAGLGPENVVLVVNANSAGSKEVANRYIRLRNLPAVCVVSLDYEGPLESIGSEQFRNRILLPVLQAIDERKLSLQTDAIVYSTDFPWRVTLQGDYPEELKLPPQLRPVASLTGATYLFGFVLAKSPGLVSLDSNWYFATAPGQNRQTNTSSCRQLGDLPSRAFRSRYAWTDEGGRASDLKKGRRYLMSTMLGVTTGRGNTVDEIVAMLERAVEADVDPPTGTFYYMQNGDIRSKTRHGCYDAAAEQLRRLGARAVVRAGTRPEGANDVAGLMMGAQDLRLDTANMTIQPGAICEHLTSAGGNLFSKDYQTPLSELIRAGATAASGAVFEPYAIQAKFPTPAMHVHYRRGCSIAEAFYQSVAAPYQLLIVGDPLCQPWADRPGLEIDGWPVTDGAPQPGMVSTLGFKQLGIAVDPPPRGPGDDADAEGDADDPATGDPPALKITPRVTPATGESGAAFWELFVDGRLRMRLPSGAGTALTDEQLGPGWHALRCVGIGPGPIEPQRQRDGLLVVAGDDIATVTLEADAANTPLGGKVAVSASAPGAERIRILHHAREVASIDGESGGALIPAELLGRGPVRLQAIAEPGGAASAPIWTQID